MQLHVGVGSGGAAQRHVHVGEPCSGGLARPGQLPERHLRVGIGGREGIEQLGSLHHRRPAQKAPLEKIAVGARARLRGAVGVCHGRHRGPGGLEVCLSGGGQRHAARMAHEQGDAQSRLELGDRLREGRLRDMEPARRARYLALLGDHHEVAQLAQLRHRTSRVGGVSAPALRRPRARYARRDREVQAAQPEVSAWEPKLNLLLYLGGFRGGTGDRGSARTLIHLSVSGIAKSCCDRYPLYQG